MKNFLLEKIFQKIVNPKKIFHIAAGVLLFLALCYAFYAGITVNSAVVQTKERKLPIYSVETDEKVVALTFNCAWNIDDLDSILDTLKKNKIKASFFMTGEWVDNYPEAVNKIAGAGHDLASHGDTHAHMNQLSAEGCREEINGVHKKVFELTGVEMDLFRPPYGEYNNAVIETAQSCGYYPIQWEIDSLDWKNYGVEAMTERVVESDKLANGAIILMHNGTQYTAIALQGIIDGLENKGYDFVPVSELIIRQNYTIDHTGRQIREK
ncbi:MAG: polysaccharide deacetylase family protein [Lachnospiraceae bacterium]|nr:polysaccharide deacetylase family protein [Lachnospiraceae bacterium]